MYTKSRDGKVDYYSDVMMACYSRQDPFEHLLKYAVSGPSIDFNLFPKEQRPPFRVKLISNTTRERILCFGKP